jgi:hypothetical protein
LACRRTKLGDGGVSGDETINGLAYLVASSGSRASLRPEQVRQRSAYSGWRKAQPGFRSCVRTIIRLNFSTVDGVVRSSFRFLPAACKNFLCPSAPGIGLAEACAQVNQYNITGKGDIEHKTSKSCTLPPPDGVSSASASSSASLDV